MNSDKMNLGPFLTELESRLDELSAEQVKRCIINHAEDVSPDERRQFLSIFSVPTDEGQPAEREEEMIEDPSLIGDIEDFVESIEEGVYFMGYGWDDRLQTKRAFGDESWAWEMDDLFWRCAEVFKSGNYQLAADGYRKLLNAFYLEEETGHFCGPDFAENMVDTDVEEAKSRHLRSVYNTTPTEKRPECLFTELDELYYIGNSQIGLKEVREAEAEDLPDIEGFLPEWIDFLKEKATAKRSPANKLRENLLRKAVEMADGVEGLSRLAREKGDVQPDAYHRWVTRLVEEDDIPGAIEAAQEGVEAIVEGREKAKLADYLAQMAADSGETDLVLESRRTAFSHDPSACRLVACWSACKDMDEEVEPFMADLLVNCQSEMEHSADRLMAMVELAAGKYDAAVARLEEAEALGWSRREHPGYAVFPFLLLAGADLQDVPAPSCMNQMVEQLESLQTSFMPPHYPYPDIRDPLANTTYRDVLLDSLARHTIDEDDQGKYVTLAREVAWERMAAIVSNQHRGAYERASCILVSVAEAVSLMEDAESGMELPLRAREKFPRHSAFRRELNHLISYSSILPDTEV